jgi:hypothetical protein
VRDVEGLSLEERVAYLEGVMQEREVWYPTAVEAWELNPLEHPERTLEERISVLERRVDAWSRRYQPPSDPNASAALPRR